MVQFLSLDDVLESHAEQIAAYAATGRAYDAFAMAAAAMSETILRINSHVWR